METQWVLACRRIWATIILMGGGLYFMYTGQQLPTEIKDALDQWLNLTLVGVGAIATGILPLWSRLRPKKGTVEPQLRALPKRPQIVGRWLPLLLLAFGLSALLPTAASARQPRQVMGGTFAATHVKSFYVDETDILVVHCNVTAVPGVSTLAFMLYYVFPDPAGGDDDYIGFKSTALGAGASASITSFTHLFAFPAVTVTGTGYTHTTPVPAMDGKYQLEAIHTGAGNFTYACDVSEGGR